MNGLCNFYLLGDVVGIPYSDMVDTGSLVWLLVGLESGGCWPFPSLKGEGCDVGCFWGGSFPITLEIPTHNESLMWEDLR
jgi:hypothetical protein